MRFRILLPFFAALFLAAFPASAARFRTAVHEDFQRVVFDIGKPFSYRVSTDGKTVSIRLPFQVGEFDKTVKARLPKEFKKGAAVKIDSDGSASYIFPILEPKAYKIMTFDNKLVLDLFTIKQKDMPLDSSVKTQIAAVNVSDLQTITPSRVKTAFRNNQPASAPFFAPDAFFDFSFEALPGLALFERAGIWWIVFDSPLKGETALDHDLILSSAYTNAENVTIYTLLLHPQYRLSSSITPHAQGWRISIVPRNASALPLWDVPVFPVTALNGTPSFIFLADPGMTEPIKVDRTQPFYVVPTKQAQAGVSEELHFVDMDFLKTEQGIVIDPNRRDFSFEKNSFGLDVKGLSGRKLNLSAEDPYLTFGVLSLFDTEDSEEALLHRIRTDKDTAGMNRLKLSAHYIRQGDFLKANDMLNAVFLSKDPMSQSGFFRLLKGMTRFSLGYPDESLAYFIHPIVSDTPESLMWQAIINKDDATYARYSWYMRFYPQKLKESVLLFGEKNS